MEEFCAKWHAQFLSVLRIMTGLLFMEHGTAKYLGFPHLEKVPEPLSMSGVSGMLELVGGALIVLGLFTRPVAFILCGEMAFAYFIEHLPRNFIPLLNGGALAIMFCFACLFLVFAGGGPWSLDAVVRKKG